MSLNNIYLKYLIRAHTIIGVFVVFIFFLSTYFGTITLFKPYVNTWENISRHISLSEKSNFDLDKSIENALIELKNPETNIQIELPSFKESTLAVKYGFSENIYINPNTNEVLNTKNESSLISNFFNQMHINLNLKRPGQLLMGVVSITIIFLTISGIYLWLVNRKKRVSSGTFWFRWHKDLSLVILPYIIIFSLTGAVLGIMLSTSGTFAYSATDGKTTNMSKLVRPVVFSRPCMVKKSGQEATMISISKLFQKAKIDYPNLKIRNIVLNAWNDQNACIAFRGYLKDNRAITGNSNRVFISYNAASGELIKKQTLDDSHSMAKVLSAFYWLHFLPDEGIVVRILFLIFGIVFATSLIFGIMIWLDKRAKKFKGDMQYFSFVSKFSLALFIGVIPATSFLLFLHWALPFYLHEKSIWLIGGFFSFWSFTLFYSVYKQNHIESIKSFMKLNLIFLVLCVIFHGIRSKYFIWDSFMNNMYEIFLIDLSLLVFALISYLISKKMPQLKLLEGI